MNHLKNKPILLQKVSLDRTPPNNNFSIQKGDSFTESPDI